MPQECTIHATVISLNGKGVLLRGPSGAGKSDLALRLIDQGAVLVSDDRTLLIKRGDRLFASAPKPLKGLLEVRGLGIRTVPHLQEVPLDIVVDLVERSEMPRMPETDAILLETVRLKRYALCAFDGSTPGKIRLALMGDI